MGQRIKGAVKSNDSKPLVSVIIPTYNSARYIIEAVESALNQLDTPPEVVVVDDGSTDNTRQVLLPYINQIRYAYQENQGPSAARNHGIKLSHGQYIVFLDADDILLPGTFAEEVACLKAQPSLGMIHGGVRLIDEHGKTLREMKPWYETPRLDLETCLCSFPIHMGAFMVRRKWIEHVGGFDSNFRWAEDVDLILRLTLAGCKMEWLQQPVLNHRRHGSSLTTYIVEAVEALQAVMDKFFARPEVPEQIHLLEKKIRYYQHIWAARRLYSLGRTDQIPEILRKSLGYSPYTFKQTILGWMKEFADEYSLEGDPAEVGDWVPYLQTAISPDRLPWVQSQKLFHWWLNIWRFYVDDDDEQDVSQSMPYRELRPGELIALAQSSLLLTPTDRMMNVVAQFWECVLEIGLVSSSKRYEVTGLYLTAFGQAFLVREWTIALQCLGQAVRSSVHPRALGSWFRFVRSAFIYFIRRPEGPDRIRGL